MSDQSPSLAAALEFGDRFAAPLEAALVALAAAWPVPPRLRAAAAAEVVERVRAVLDVPLDEMLAAGWRTFEGCRELCRQPAGETATIELAEHAVHWTATPTVEVVAESGAALVEVKFRAEVEVRVKAGVLVVQGGRFVRLRAAALEISGTLALADAPVAEWSRPLPVPGTMRLGNDGIAVCPEPVPPPGAVGSTVRVPAISP